MSIQPWPDADADRRDWLDTEHTPPTRSEVLNPEDLTYPTNPPEENHARPTTHR